MTEITILTDAEIEHIIHDDEVLMAKDFGERMTIVSRKYPNKGMGIGHWMRLLGLAPNPSH